MSNNLFYGAHFIILLFLIVHITYENVCVPMYGRNIGEFVNYDVQWSVPNVKMKKKCRQASAKAFFVIKSDYNTARDR